MDLKTDPLKFFDHAIHNRHDANQIMAQRQELSRWISMTREAVENAELDGALYAMERKSCDRRLASERIEHRYSIDSLTLTSLSLALLGVLFGMSLSSQYDGPWLVGAAVLASSGTFYVWARLRRLRAQRLLELYESEKA